MTTITIALSDDRFEQLRQLAQQLDVSTDELIRMSIDELLSRHDNDFLNAAQHVFDKNKDLYRRLE